MNFLEIKKVILPSTCVEQAYDHIRNAGSQRLEGVVLFSGRYQEEQKHFQVLETIVPHQLSVNIDRGLLYAVSGDELHRINVYLHSTKQILLAQLHSHPTEAYHSSTDDAFPIVTKVGGFSIVVPNFGMNEFQIEDWAVYRLSQKLTWDEVDTPLVKSIIQIS